MINLIPKYKAFNFILPVAWHIARRDLESSVASAADFPEWEKLELEEYLRFGVTSDALFNEQGAASSVLLYVFNARET